MTKHRLQKSFAMLNAGLIIVTMGACSSDKEILSETSQMSSTLSSNTQENTSNTFSIFEEPEFIETVPPETNIIPSVQDDITKTSDNEYHSRFTNQEQLEIYLEQTYNASGKDYWQIINEVNIAKKNGDYSANYNDLSASAGYMLLKDNGLSLDDVTLELDYVLCLVNNPREEFEEDREALKVLYDVTGGESVYSIFYQIALERHLISCPSKSNHKNNLGDVMCSELDEEKILTQIANREKAKDAEQSTDEYEIGPVLIKKIKQLIGNN